MRFSDDRIAFPVANARPGVDFCRALINADSIRDAASTLPPAAVTLAALLLAAQVGPQRPTFGLVGINVLVDQLRGHPKLLFPTQAPADLLRTPVSTNQFLKQDPILVRNSPPHSAAPRSRSGQSIRLPWPITAEAAIATNLS